MEKCWICGKEITENDAVDKHHDESRVERLAHTKCHREMKKRVVCKLCGQRVSRNRQQHLKEKHPGKFGHLTMEELMKE